MVKKELLRNFMVTVLVGLILSMNSIDIFASKYIYENEAASLNKYGLYKGVSTTIFDPGLGMIADRETGLVMLLRLVNEEKNALGLDDTVVDELLSNFADGSEISGWARKQIAYAVKVGIVKGYPDKTLKPKEILTSKTYCTMILKALGHDFEFNQSVNLFCDLSGTNGGLREEFLEDGSINRDLMVGISYRAILASYKQDGKTLRQKLLDEGVIKIEREY